MGHVHRGESLLGQRTGASGVVAEAHLPRQYRAAKVEGLSVGQHPDRVDVEPAAAVDPEGQGKPVRQVDQTLVVDCGARYVVDETVVNPGGIGARVVHLAGLRFGRGAPGGEIAISHRAQRLTKLLAVRVIPLIGEIPCRGGLLMFVRKPIRPALDELPHLIGTLQSETGGRLAVAILVVAHHDPDAVELDCVESVFVGEVVADVDGQQGARRVDAITDPGQRGPFVPVDVRSQLDQHAPARHA